MEITAEELAAANARGARRRATTPVIHSVRCTRAVLTIAFTSGMQLSVPTRLIQGLADAAPSALRRVEVSPAGTGLHFPAVDADVYVPGLLRGIYGTRHWMKEMAAEFGTAGGRVSSAAKRAAARRNGRLGGRPRKVA